MMLRPKRFPRPVLAATLLAGLCAAPVDAQDMPSGPATAKLAKEFDQADTDKDGKLSDDEAKKAGFFTTDQKFDSVDADGDGQITLFEFGDAVQKRLRGYMSDRDSADKDGDGYVTEDEAKLSGSSILDIFRKADKDGDGKVARDEIDVYVHDSYYSETADRGVVPNIFNKKF
jgi:Ca2+-binding EF-hand superfamily protein